MPFEHKLIGGKHRAGTMHVSTWLHHSGGWFGVQRVHGGYVQGHIGIECLYRVPYEHKLLGGQHRAGTMHLSTWLHRAGGWFGVQRVPDGDVRGHSGFG